MANIRITSIGSIGVPKIKIGGARKITGKQVAAIKAKDSPEVSKLLGQQHGINVNLGKTRLPPGINRNPLFAERGPNPAANHSNIRNPSTHLDKLLSS